MDYSKLSDFEINKRVAICIHPEIRDWNCYDVSGRACFVINENTPKRVQFGFSFTTNPADAWPIILSNRIGVVPGTASDKWAAHYCNWDIAIADTNPLRAAMIVFLMIQESQDA